MRWIVLLMTTLLLGGCAGPATPAAEQTQSLVATEETGILHGVVVDEAVVPVAGATVRLPDAERNATTDDGGRFGFGSLPPGTYRVEVSRSGFMPLTATATVEAAVQDPPLLKVQLVAVGPDWYIEAFQVAGALENGMTVRVAGQDGPSSSCCSDYFWKLDLTRGAPDWLQSEAVWDPVTPGSEHMQLTHSAGETCVDSFIVSACALDIYSSVEGPSPLLLADAGADIPVDPDDPEQQITVSLFVGHHGPEGVAEAGAAVDQGFEFFVHAFYGLTPPEGWSFVEDGNPPVPEQ